MFGKMPRSEYTNGRDQEIMAWVEERIKNVPAENRQRAFVNAAKTEAMKEGMRAPRVQV